MVQKNSDDPFFRVPPFTYDELPAISNIPWRPIKDLPCNDAIVLIIWRDGKTTVEDADHDSDPLWWAERGAIGWAHIERHDLSVMEAQYRIYRDTLINIATHFGTSEGLRDIAEMGLNDAERVERGEVPLYHYPQHERGKQNE